MALFLHKEFGLKRYLSYIANLSGYTLIRPHAVIPLAGIPAVVLANAAQVVFAEMCIRDSTHIAHFNLQVTDEKKPRLMRLVKGEAGRY